MIKGSRIALISALTIGGFTQSIQAMPMFSTQTGMSCSGCHAQQMPKLNKFGRKFVASGMTISQTVSDMNETDRGLISDMDINPSLLVKVKYQKTVNKPTKSGRVQEDDEGTNGGEWSIPRTMSLLLGGRVSENIGALIRLGVRKEEGGSISGKAVYAKEIEDGYVGVSFYSSSNFGPFSGMELYNTGLYKPIRSFEIRKFVNATQACSVGTGSATGLQLYYDKDGLFNDEDHLFVSIGMYAPVQDNLYMDMGSNLLPMGRIAYEYPLGDYNLIFGAFAIVGGSDTDKNSPLSVKRETYGLDFQLEGEIAERSISVIATNIFKNEVSYTGMGAGSTEDLQSLNNDAFSIEGQIMATEELGIKLAYLQFNDLKDYKNRKFINVKDIDSAITLGTDYTFVVVNIPIKLAAEYSWVTPSLDRVEKYKDFLLTLTMPF